MTDYRRDEIRPMGTRARHYAAAQIAIVAFDEPPEIAEPLYRIAARLIAPIETTGADAMPRATVWEVESRDS